MFSNAFALGQNFIEDIDIYGTEKNILEFPSFFDSSFKLDDNLLSSKDSIEYFRNLAVEYSNKNDVDNAMLYIKKYIKTTADLSFINDHLFSNISNTEKYVEFKEKHLPKFNFMAIIYFYAGFLGIFIFVILNIKKELIE